MLPILRISRIFAFALTMVVGAGPLAAEASFDVSINIGVAPPPLPIYEQPPCVIPDTIWIPGYWAWGYDGYYWVPGTWAQAPQAGYLWTPGYWGYNDGVFSWNEGYWGPHIGFYGGVNYGFGYIGTGFFGGTWSGGFFHYNTAVTNVNTNIVRNVYVNKTVINNYYNSTNNVTVNRTSFNGGPRGIAVRPTTRELLAAREQHISATPIQQQNRTIASENRNYLAAVNHGRPPVSAVQRPLSRTYHPHFAPIVPQDRALATKRYPDVARMPVAPARGPQAIERRKASETAPTLYRPSATAPRIRHSNASGTQPAPVRDPQAIEHRQASETAPTSYRPSATAPRIRHSDASDTQLAPVRSPQAIERRRASEIAPAAYRRPAAAPHYHAPHSHSAPQPHPHSVTRHNPPPAHAAHSQPHESRH